jgi:hypothetical protein
MWGIIGHVTVEAGNTVGTDGAPPQQVPLAEDNRRKDETRQVWRKTKKRQEPVPEQKNQKNAIYKYKGRPIQNSKNQRRLPVGFTHQIMFSFRPVISENLETIHIIEIKIRIDTFSSF